MACHALGLLVYLVPGCCCCLLQIRAELPSPKAGQLPLPSSLPDSLQQQLSGALPGWQDLPWPQGQAPQQPATNSKAALQFKVGICAQWVAGVVGGACITRC